VCNPVRARITKQAAVWKMRRNQRDWRLFVSILGFLALSPALAGQASPNSERATPLATDWSHHHLIFSKQINGEQAKRVQQDRRYRQQEDRRSSVRLPKVESRSAVDSVSRLSTSAFQGRNQKLKRDWSQDMGSGASVGAGNYPAKFSFSITQASCADAVQPDFVVYGTGLSGSSGQANIVAYDNIYSGCSGLSLGTNANFAILASATVTNAENTVVTGANIGIFPGTSLTGFPPGVLTPPAVQHLGDPVAGQAQADANTAYTYYQGLSGATGIASSLDGQTLAPGLYKAASSLALSAGATVTLNGDGTYIFQIGSTLNLAGTVVLSGGATAGNVIWLVGSSATLEGTTVAVGDIVALASITMDGGASLAGRAIALNGAVTMIDNAVTTVDAVPSVYWAYNTGGTILTSPAFSLDGTQMLFVQTDGVQHGHLILLKWAASTTETIASPTTLTRVARASYPTCTAPCITSAPLSDSAGTADNDTNSSVFYDYDNDTAYVGDNSGWLHKFTPVLRGILTEVKTGGWPVHVNPSTPTALTSPVHDYASGNVFVEDVGGFLYLVNSTTANVISSGQLDFGVGFVEGPVVDSTAGLVYAFASSDGSGNCGGGANCSGVYEFGTSFAAGDTGLEVVIGASTVSGTIPNPLYAGAFDSTYEDSTNATGKLYVCGNTGGTPILYQIAIQGGILGTVNTGPTLSSSTTPCSPVSDILNPNAIGGPTEWLFASAQANGVSSGCAAEGCLMNFKDTPWLPFTNYVVGQEVVDSNFDIQVVDVGGVSGNSVPFWSKTLGGPTADGTVQWLDQGTVSAFTPAAWIANHTYTKSTLMLDSNNNIELVTSTGTSGSLTPVWSTTAGATTPDDTVTWKNLGAIATSALAAAGGTSGIIIDNTVGSGTLAGASQSYFSTLSNQSCGTSGTGGCAVQASQSALR
jgi:hypothetical protein